MEHKITPEELVAYFAGYLQAKYGVSLTDADIAAFQWTAGELYRVAYNAD